MATKVVENRRRRTALLVFFGTMTSVLAWFVLAMAVGVSAGPVLLAVVIGVGLTTTAYLSADRAVLSLSRAVPADPTTYARLHNLIDGICLSAGLSKPSVFVIEDDAPNALTVGRSIGHASVAVTTGLLSTLDRMELEAVLAHELAHVRSADLPVATLAITTVGLPTLVSDRLIQLKWWNGGRRGREDHAEGANPMFGALGTALLVFGPIIAPLIRWVVGPDRVTRADLMAVETTRYPPGLISALEKLRSDSTVVSSGARCTAHLWLAVPLARTADEGELSTWNERFVDHPDLDQRIETLREL